MPRFIALASLAAALALPASAFGADVSACYERKSVLDKLRAAYSEVPIGMGIGANGSVIELLRGSTGSWTLLMTMPVGVTCIIAAGESWEAVPRPQTAEKPGI